MYDRDRLAPVTLTGEYPVTQFVVDGFVSDAHLLNDMRSFFFQDCRLHTIPVTGIDHSSGGLGIGFGHILDFFAVFCDNLDDRNIEFLCKLKVTVIVSRYTHDRTGTVICQYIVREPDRNFCSVQRIGCIASGKYAGLFLILHTVYVGFHGCCIDIGIHGFFLIRCGKTCCQFMLRSQYHKGCTVKSIRSCRINGDLFVSSFYRKIDFCTIRFADPLGLHFLYFLRPFQFVQVT